MPGYLLVNQSHSPPPRTQTGPRGKHKRHSELLMSHKSHHGDSEILRTLWRGSLVFGQQQQQQQRKSVAKIPLHAVLPSDVCFVQVKQQQLFLERNLSELLTFPEKRGLRSRNNEPVDLRWEKATVLLHGEK